MALAFLSASWNFMERFIALRETEDTMTLQTQRNVAFGAVPKIPARTQTASTKLTEKEFSELEDVAVGRGISPGEWIREVLMREVRRASGRESSQVILTEIVGVQLLLMNVLKSIACGDSMTAAGFDKIVQEVHRAKREIAQRIAQEGE